MGFFLAIFVLSCPNILEGKLKDESRGRRASEPWLSSCHLPPNASAGIPPTRCPIGSSHSLHPGWRHDSWFSHLRFLFSFSFPWILPQSMFCVFSFSSWNFSRIHPTHPQQGMLRCSLLSFCSSFVIFSPLSLDVCCVRLFFGCEFFVTQKSVWRFKLLNFIPARRPSGQCGTGHFFIFDDHSTLERHRIVVIFLSPLS